MTDAIVIGAGIAGLAATRVLLESGLTVRVVEAAARTGGRIHTARWSGWPIPVELGAEFVHARPPFFERALREAELAAEPHEGAHVLAQSGRLRRAEHAWQAAFRVVEQLPDEDVGYATAVSRPSIRRRAGPATLAMAQGYVEGFNAAEAERISARALFLQSKADEAYQGGRIERALGGYDRLAEAFLAAIVARRGRLELATEAREIDWRGPELLVQCRRAYGRERVVFRSQAAIVTVPIRMLGDEQPRRLRFRPALPLAKRQAIASIAMGSVTKLIVRFRRKLWDGGTNRGLPARTARGLRGLSFLHTPDASVPTWWVPRPLDVPILVGWAAGPAAVRFARRHGGRLQGAVEVALAGLAAALGVDRDALLGQVEDARLIDWSTVPFTFGAYSWLPVGALAAPAMLGKPLENRVFFAGEATHTGHQMGTVHGALETGLRAAAGLRASLEKS